MLIIKFWTDLCPNEKFNGVNSGLVELGEALLDQEPYQSFLRVDHGKAAMAELTILSSLNHYLILFKYHHYL